jgi:hypothetical protein
VGFDGSSRRIPEYRNNKPELEYIMVAHSSAFSTISVLMHNPRLETFLVKCDAVK